MINQAILEEWRPYVRGYIDEQLKWSALWGQTLEERAACYEEFGRRRYERGRADAISGEHVERIETED